MSPDPPERLTRAARWAASADWPMAVLGLAVVPILLVEEQSTSQSLQAAALAANWLIWVAFAGDLVVRWAADGFRARFLRRGWLNLAIVLVTIPVSVDLLRGVLAVRAARALRLVRLVRIGGVARLTFRRYNEALARRRFHYVTAIAAAVVGLGAVGLYLLESDRNPSVGTMGDAVWWAIVTATTVGYGDISPMTLEGRAIAVVLMLVGIGVIGLFTATVSSYMFAGEEGGVSNAELLERLDRIERLVGELHRAQGGRAGATPAGAGPDGGGAGPVQPVATARRPDSTALSHGPRREDDAAPLPTP